MDKVEIRVVLSKYNEGGSLARIESEDHGNIVLVIAEDHQDGPVMCKAAAKYLRHLAMRFDMLAETQEPFKCTFQDAVNPESTRDWS